MIRWKDEYRIGVEKIDEQHKKLFEIAGRAYDLLKNEFYIDKYDRIVEILNELKDYTVYHFNSEEEYMKSIGYRRFLSHKVEHDDFIEKINSVDFSKIDSNQDKYILDLLEFIVNWIDKHILGRDKLIVS
ncbi:bacteriohemerythrin [Thermoanaerobacterium sp. DL9XJH110]|uniref:bacteriohemerythrin n=1 Tax=Thermoanaerobacterium sp. DL9XJH110 TaxID=3386643 RepID=UPI003BB65B13